MKARWIALLILVASMVNADLWQNLKNYEYGNEPAAPEQLEELVRKAPPGKRGAIEAELIGVVSSKNATVEGRAFACRMLRRIGTDKSVPALAALLDDQQLRHYARYALGSMDSTAAKAALGPLQESLRPTAPVVPAAEAAETFAALIRSDTKRAATVAAETLESKLSARRSGVLRQVATVQSTDFTRALAKDLPDLPPGLQAEAIALLGARGDAAAVPALAGFLDGPDLAVRQAAIAALGRIGGAKEAGLLFAQMQDDACKAVAVDALARLDGEGVDDAIIDRLSVKETCADAVAVLGKRNCIAATPALLALTDGADAAMRQAAWLGLAEVATDDYVDAMMKRSLAIDDPREKADAQHAVKETCAQATDAAKCMEAVAPYYAAADLPAKLFILDVARRAGAAEALALVLGALEAGDAELRKKALRTLAAWPNAAAAPVLLELTQDASEEVERILALRGYIQCTAFEKNSNRQLAMYTDALALSKRPDEKRMVVSGLGATKNVKAVGLIRQLLRDPALREEAEAAALQLAGSIAKRNGKESKELAAEIIARSKNKRHVKQAEALASAAGKSPRKKKRK